MIREDSAAGEILILIYSLQKKNPKFDQIAPKCYLPSREHPAVIRVPLGEANCWVH